MSTPFDRTLPSPIIPVLALRSDGQDSVVSVGGPSDLQQRTYRPGRLDDALQAAAQASRRPHAIIATGSAGSGKSAAVEQQRLRHRDLYSDIIEDATHSDRPSRTQATALRDRLMPLGDGQRRPDRPILIAANTGMLLQLFDGWRGDGGFSAFEAAALAPLGLHDSPDADDLRVTVLNFDDRPTAGQDGLLEQLIQQLDPDDPAGVMGGSARCGTCTVREWCPARTNAALAAGAGAGALSGLASAAARERGRHDSPRALWDWLSRLVAPPEAFRDHSDPCDAVAQAAANSDLTWRLKHLLPVSVFSAEGDVGRRVAELNPVLGTSGEAYRILSSAGIDPVKDAGRLNVLADLEPRAEAVSAAAAALRRDDSPGEDASPYRMLIGRAGTGCALLANPSDWPLDRDNEGATFAAALHAYGEWQSADSCELSDEERRRIDNAAEQLLEPLIAGFGEGLARLFGVFAENRPFLPLRSYDPRNRSRIHVLVDIDVRTVQVSPDLQIERNALSAVLLGHQPLAIRLLLPGGDHLSLDLPAFRLLLGAREQGLAAASQSDERFHALRRAAEDLARDAAVHENSQLLAEEEGRFYLISQAASLSGRTSLRIRMVNS